MNWEEVAYGGECLSFDAFFNTTLQTTGCCMSLCLTFFQHLAYCMHILKLHESDSRLLWRKIMRPVRLGQPERQKHSCFFSWPRPPFSVARPSSITTCCSGRKQKLHVETFEIEEKTQKSAVELVCCPPSQMDCKSMAGTCCPGRFTPIWSTEYEALLLQVIAIPLPRWEERSETRRMRKLFEDCVSNLVPPGFSGDQLPCMAVKPVLDLTTHCWQPTGIRCTFQEGAYMQFKPRLGAAAIHESQHVNIFFDHAYVKFLRDMAWYIGALGSPCSLRALQSKSPEACWKMMGTAASQSLRPAFSFSGHCEICFKGNNILKPWQTWCRRSCRIRRWKRWDRQEIPVAPFRRCTALQTTSSMGRGAEDQEFCEFGNKIIMKGSVS